MKNNFGMWTQLHAVVTSHGTVSQPACAPVVATGGCLRTMAEGRPGTAHTLRSYSFAGQLAPQERWCVGLGGNTPPGSSNLFILLKMMHVLMFRTVEGL